MLQHRENVPVQGRLDGVLFYKGEIMKRYVTLVNVFFLVTVLCLHYTVMAQSPVPEMEKLMTMYAEQKWFSGSVLVVQKGKVLLSKGYGMANYELDVPNTPKTKFRLGSVSKQFTAAAILQLQERGLLNVHDALSKFIPDYPHGDSITVHQLLNHTSGVADFTSMMGYKASMRNATTLEETIAIFKKEPLDFTPGTEYSYSNSNYVLLSYIIEKVSGETYAHYIRTHIFEPLGMTDSGYDNADDLIKNRASGYRTEGDGFANASFIDMMIPAGAGGLYSTTEDMYKWDRALYTEKVLKKQSLDAMFTPGLDHYGYGWAILDKPRKMITHSGGINGFVSNIARFPDDDVCIIVLGNSEDAESVNITNRLTAILFDNYTVPAVAKIDTSVYTDYAGEYELAPDFLITISTEDGRLFAQATGQNRFEIYPSSQTKFFLKVVDAQLTFVRGAEGRVDTVILHQGGADTPAKRIAARPTAAVDTAVYASYVGTYELAPGFSLKISTSGGRLFAQATGQDQFEIYPSSETEFFLKVVNAQISFVKSGTGTVDKLILHQGGRDTPGIRIK